MKLENLMSKKRRDFRLNKKEAAGVNDKRGICSGGAEQLPGQMNVYDYEEWLTDEMRKGIEDGKYSRSSSVYELRGDLQGVQSGKE